MKIKDWLVTAGGIVFVCLFYKQSHGINFTIYSFFIILCLAISMPQVSRQKNWWLAVVGLALSSVCIAVYGSFVSFVGIVFSLLLVAAYSVKHNAPAVLNFVQGGLNIVLSVPNFFKGLHRAAERKKTKNPDKKGGFGYMYIIIIAVFIVFVLLYSASSKAFSDLLKKIDLSFISFGWIITAILGFFFTHGLLKHRRLKQLDIEEKSWGKPLIAALYPQSDVSQINLEQQNKAGTMLLALLNILLLVVNITDIGFLAKGINKPADYNFSELVHQGIGALILSIVFAIVIIMYFFRGQLNFEKAAKPLYILALLWMAQNIILISTGACKNYLYTYYVDGLTYKRVGVYFYLLLSAIGLVFTAIKIYAKKPNWYLVRVNFTAFFTVLILCTPFDWDGIITNYNIKKAVAEHKDPDIKYLLTFTSRNLPQITEWAKEKVNNPTTLYNYSAEEFNEIMERLKKKASRFEHDFKETGWQSWNYAAEENYYYLAQVQWDKLVIPVPDEKTIGPATGEEYDRDGEINCVRK